MQSCAVKLLIKAWVTRHSYLLIATGGFITFQYETYFNFSFRRCHHGKFRWYPSIFSTAGASVPQGHLLFMVAVFRLRYRILGCSYSPSESPVSGTLRIRCIHFQPLYYLKQIL